jgi:hypothetical protein
MRSLALLIALSTFCEPAIAQTAECQSIPKASDRLACYDKAAPPAGKGQALRGGNPGISIAAWSGCRYARGGKFSFGRQDQEYLPRLLTRISGWTPCRLIQINAVGRDEA